METMEPEMIQYWVNNGIRTSKHWDRSYEYAKEFAHHKWMALKSRWWDALGSGQADFWREQWVTYLNADNIDCAPCDFSQALAANKGAGASCDGEANAETIAEATSLGPK